MKPIEAISAVAANLSKHDFITYIENSFFNDDISIDACVGEALTNDYFPRAMLCTKTI